MTDEPGDKPPREPPPATDDPPGPRPIHEITSDSGRAPWWLRVSSGVRAMLVLGLVASGFAGGVAYSRVAALGPVVLPVAGSALTMTAPPDAGLLAASDAGPISDHATYTEAEYEDELAADLAKCEPAAMLRYEQTVPFWVYGNPVLRKAVTEVMLRKNFNGWSWILAANGDAGVALYKWHWSLSKDPPAGSWQEQRRQGRRFPALPDAEWTGDPLEQARNRLVRMSAACVNIFFDGSLLAVDRRGSDLTVQRRPSRFPEPPPPRQDHGPDDPP